MRSASSRPRPQAYRPCCPSAWARRRASSPMVMALISSRMAGWPGGGSAQYSPVARPCQIRHCGYRRLSRSSSASSPSPRGPPVMARDGGLRRRGPQADEAAMTASAQRLAPARRTLRCRRASTRHAQGSGGSARPGQGRSSRSPPAAKGWNRSGAASPPGPGPRRRAGPGSRRHSRRRARHRARVRGSATPCGQSSRHGYSPARKAGAATAPGDARHPGPGRRAARPPLTARIGSYRLPAVRYRRLARGHRRYRVLKTEPTTPVPGGHAGRLGTPACPTRPSPSPQRPPGPGCPPPRVRPDRRTRPRIRPWRTRRRGPGSGRQ